MRVCFFGLFDPAYPRNAVLRRGLQTCGVDVVECRGPLAFGATPSLLPLRRARQLVQAFHALPPCDVLYLPEFNQALTPLAAWLARKHRIPLVSDFLVSLYDTAVRDRGQSRWRPRPQLLGLGDRLAAQLSACVLTDTDTHARYFAELYGHRFLSKAATVYVGAPDWTIPSTPLPPRTANGVLRVLFVGYYIPLHGVEYIVRAAKLVAPQNRFEFLLIGSGQTFATVQSEAHSLNCTNVDFLPSVSFDRLPFHFARADICLGIFGATAKAKRVIPNKVWQALAAGRPVITGDSPAAREAFENERDCLLIPFADAEALANSLVRLADDEALAERLAARAGHLAHDKFSSHALGRRFERILADLVARGA